MVAAAYGQIPLQQAASAPELRSSLAPVIAASTWTLSYGDNLRIHNVDTALRLLGRLASPLQSSSPLYGASELEKAQVDGWLSFFWSSVDLPIQAMLQAPQQQQEEKNGSQTRDSTVELEFRSALSNIDLHLLFRTYLVGNAITVADIALAISVEMALHAKLWVPPPPPSSLEHNVSDGGVFGLNLMRHYETLKNQAWFKNGGKTLTPSPALMAAGGAGVLLNGPAPAVVNKMYRRNRIRVKEVIANDGTAYIDQSISVAGWARTVRKASSKLLFIELNDGSCSESLQCVVDANDCVEGFEGCKTSGGTGASFAFTGQLIASKGTGQAVELQVTSAKLLGAVYAGNVEGTTIGGGFYPLSKKEHTLEHSRDVAHLRPRTAVHAAAMRIRHCMAYATHNFFHNHGFLYIHTPIITGADCEGAGEQFGVTGLLGNDHLKPDIALPVHPPPKEPTEDSEKQPISKSEQKRLAKQQKKKGTGAAAAESNKPLEEEVVVGAVDYTKDFFGQRVNLTVSGQLNVETHACALSDVYTFGPTFRAEYSFTSRHLSEFWMIEPEIAFADLTDDINLAEDYLKYCVQFALENCAPDLEFFENSPHGEAGLRARLRNVLENPFKVSVFFLLMGSTVDSKEREDEPQNNGNLSETTMLSRKFFCFKMLNAAALFGVVPPFL